MIDPIFVALLALLALGLGLLRGLIRLRSRVGVLEDFDEPEMVAREDLGARVKRLAERIGPDWASTEEEDDDD